MNKLEDGQEVASVMRDFHYYFRDYYHCGEYIEVQGDKLICELSSKYALNQQFEGVIHSDRIEIVSKHKEFVERRFGLGNINLDFEYDPELAEDGYVLKVEKERILIAARNKRGIQYAVDALDVIAESRGGSIRLPLVAIHDEPSFRIRGIIEGFYGEPWTFADRLDSIEFMARHRMNTFLYAPKDDRYHRELWREPYPEAEFANIRTLKQHCDERHIDFYYCISPGNDMKFASPADFECIFRKLRAMMDIGVKHFAVLMDDIDYVPKEENAHFLERPGLAHAYLVNEINRFLQESLPHYRLVMCPSEYWSYWDTEYKKDIRETMDASVLVFWTGYFVFAPVIDRKHASDNRRFYGHDLILWDNIPVNDADRGRIFMGPVRNRYSRLAQHGHVGFVSNPMNQWELSKIPLITLSHYMWNSERYEPDVSWNLAVNEFAPELVDAMTFFCANNDNGRLWFGRDEALERAIETRDVAVVDRHYQQWASVLEQLQAWNNEKFLSEAGPWLERAQHDIGLWRAIREALASGTEQAKAAAAEQIARSKEQQTRIGSDIALRAAERWGLCPQPEPTTEG
ncbi:beta-N-acetylglucosaminidase domain-containing protein [Paenibacillus sp. MSJ-34]|nr:beta-N-acetylglucosaminidase domain-containing protein [Paenibacillus sp. MSJ-34]